MSNGERADFPPFKEIMTIIALSGKKRVGKDEFANVMIKRHGFTKVALADDLRQIAARLFHIPPSDFEDEKKDERIPRIYLDLHHVDALREILESEWNYVIPYEAREQMEEHHGDELDTPRDILRCIGNMCRDYVDKDIWINRAIHKVKENYPRVVITDCRFQNERDVFEKIGATLIKIKRNDNGETKEHEFDLGPDDDYDVIFNNDSTLHQYQSEVDLWYTCNRESLKYGKVWKEHK